MVPHPRHARRRTSLTALCTVVAALAIGLGGAACSTSDSKDSAAATTVAATPGTGLTQDQCESRTPGEVLTADQARVLFDASQICPSFVTIGVATPVTFDNQDTVDHTITIVAGASPSGQVLDEQVVPSGGTWVRPFTDAGQFAFKIDHFPSIGVVQVEPVTTSTSASAA